jgi:hypothetical protein
VHAGGVARVKVVAVAVALLGFASPALAGVVPIAGVFGNEAGCAFYMTGKASADMVVLTPDTVSSGTGGCDFISLTATESSGFSVGAVCSGDGHEGIDAVSIADRGEAGFFVSVNGEAEWGPLTACPGVEDLSPGVRI